MSDDVADNRAVVTVTIAIVSHVCADAERHCRRHWRVWSDPAHAQRQPWVRLGPQRERWVLRRRRTLSRWRNMGNTANHSIANARKANTSSSDWSRDASITDAKMAALSDSDPGNLRT